METAKPNDYRRRLALLISTFVIVALFSGIIYGWDPMELLLQRTGVYCKANCDDSKLAVYDIGKYSLVITVAEVVAAGSGIITGLILDYFGPAWTVAFSGACVVGGTVIFGTKVSFIFGYALMALGGMAVLISAFRAGYLFPEKQHFVISAISCLFDASSVIPLVFDLINSGLKISFEDIAISYATLGVILFSVTVVLWLMNPTFNATSSTVDEVEEGQKLLSPEPAAKPALNSAVSPTEQPLMAEASDPSLRLPKPGDAQKAVLRGFQRRGGDELDEEVDEIVDLERRRDLGTDHVLNQTPPVASDRIIGEEYVAVADRPFGQQCKSPEFIYIFVFTLVHMFRNNLYLGSTHDYLTFLKDPQHHNLYSKLVGIIVPLGFVFVGLVGYIMDTKGFYFTAQLVNVLGIAYGILTSLPFLISQPFAAALFAFYRATLFSFVAAFTAVVFGSKSVGRITGILYTSTAVLIIMQAPLVQWSDKINNFVPLHVGNTVIVLIPFFLAFWLKSRSSEVGPPPPEEEEEDFLDAAPGPGGRYGSMASVTSMTSQSSSRSRRPSIASAISFSQSHMSMASLIAEDYDNTHRVPVSGIN